MTRIATLCRLSYAALIRLYPFEFRHRFGEELLGVFTAKLTEAGPLGTSAVILVWLHELAELPGNLFTEYQLAFVKSYGKGESQMSNALRSRLFFIGVGLPLGLVATLAFINPNWFRVLFSNDLGWLISASFSLMLALNALLLIPRGNPMLIGWRPALVVACAFLAALFVLFGPAFLAVIKRFPSEGTPLQSFLTIGLILIDLGCLGAGVFLTAQLSNKNSNTSPGHGAG
jgi:hypothetical protein